MLNYDFFISYKWSNHATQAKALKEIVESFGFSAWLDVDHPFQSVKMALQEDNDRALVEHLKTAMESCRYVLFFETFAKVAMQVGGRSTRVLSWHERELNMAGLQKLIVLYDGSFLKKIAFGKSQKFSEYENLHEAFRIVQLAVSGSNCDLWN